MLGAIMFTVYGVQGRLYSGPLDRMREVGPVAAVARLRALAPVARQDQAEPGVVYAGRLEEGGGGSSAGAGAGLGAEPRQALAAYAQTAAAPRQPLSLVQQLMSRRLVTVPVAASVRQAWQTLERAGVGQAPVVAADGALVGLITRADLWRDRALPQDLAEAASWVAGLARPVSELMWTPVPGAQADTPLREAAQLMLELHLPGLPVVDEQGLLQGFLSRSDLLRALTREPPLDLWT